MFTPLMLTRADPKADDSFLQDLVNPNMVPDGSDNLLTGRKCKDPQENSRNSVSHPPSATTSCIVHLTFLLLFLHIFCYL